MTIYLNKDKGMRAAKDRAETLRKFDSENSRYKLLVGAPLLVNVEGTYIYSSELPSLCYYRNDVPKVERWVESLKNPTLQSEDDITFKWKRTI